MKKPWMNLLFTGGIPQHVAGANVLIMICSFNNGWEPLNKTAYNRLLIRQSTSYRTCREESPAVVQHTSAVGIGFTGLSLSVNKIISKFPNPDRPNGLMW